jgi:broad specificity phosphatase PhoE
MAADLTTVYLIASGTTSWQEAGRLQGHIDLPLSEAGLRGAEAVAQTWLAENGDPLRSPGVVYCGEDEASVQTAGLLARGIAARVKPLAELGEMNVGLWQGLTRKELEERYPTAFGQWEEDPGRVSIPEGETLAELAARLGKGLKRAIGRGGEPVVVLVLRPIALRLCAALLGGTLAGDTGSPPAADVAGSVLRFDLDGERVRAVRAARRRKTLWISPIGVIGPVAEPARGKNQGTRRVPA